MKSTTRIEAIADLLEVLPLLEQCELPFTDITTGAPQEFFGTHAETGLNGVIGLERHGQLGLLRSLAVSSEQRNQNLGHRLVAFAEDYAASQGITKLYLLTMTAADFFSRLGYLPVPRAEAPPAIRATTQFSGLCPTTSAFMCKAISHPLQETPMSQLTPREIELVAIGAAIGSNCIPCVEYHIGAGKQLGISDDEIQAAIALADKVRRAPARKVLEAAKAALGGALGAPTSDAETASQCAALSKSA